MIIKCKKCGRLFERRIGQSSYPGCEECHEKWFVDLMAELKVARARERR